MRSRSPRLLSLAAAAGCLAVFAGIAGAADTTTLGQTGADTSCTLDEDFIVAQTSVSGGPSYTVPEGNWTITSWSAAGGSGGQEALVVFRPTGTPDEYKIVGSTSPRTLTAPQITVKANIKVKSRDLIGFWAQDGTMCARATGSSADVPSLAPSPSPPGEGTTVTLFQLPPQDDGGGYRLNISVTLKRQVKSSTASEPEPFVGPEPARIAICTAAPILRADGTIGTFADVQADQYPATDTGSPYYGAVPAKYAQGIGLTCDNLPGYTDTGYRVNGDGARAPAGQEATWPAPYEYFTKTA